MDWLFSRLVSLTPGQLLARSWIALLVLMPLTGVKPLSGIATAIGFAIMIGYPYVVALGISHHPSDARALRFARGLFRLFLVLIVLGALILPFVPDESRAQPPAQPSIYDWLGMLLVVPMNVVIFAPFFLATHLLDEARRRTGTYLHFDAVPTFLGFYFGIFGGYFYVHRLVREVTTLGPQHPTPLVPTSQSPADPR